jgi:hypothetical protein
MRTFSTNVYDTPVHYQTEMSQILMPQRASAPVEQTQVTHTGNPNNAEICLMDFRSIPSQVVYPALPETNEWIPIAEPNRKVFKCGDIYYCLLKGKCYKKDGSPGNIAPPSYDQIEELQAKPDPPPIHAEYKGTKEKPIISWKFLDTEELIWENNLWHSTDRKRFYYGYGPPAPKSTSAKN